jgi:hypothetical protein
MRSILVLTILGLAAVPVLEAQRNRAVPVHRHSGFWFSIGAGGGWDAPDGRFGTVGRGGTGYIRLGGTPHPQFLFGVELNGWENSSGVSRGAMTATALLYPSHSGGPFVKAGFGAAAYESRGFEARGIATTLGLGADIRLGRNFYLTPNVDWLVQFFEDDTRPLVLVSVGATWH